MNNKLAWYWLQHHNRPQKEPVSAGEWQYDKQGRKYRRIGKNCIEYAMTVHVCGLDIPQDELNDFYKKCRERGKKLSNVEK